MNLLTKHDRDVPLTGQLINGAAGRGSHRAPYHGMLHITECYQLVTLWVPIGGLENVICPDLAETKRGAAQPGGLGPLLMFNNC